MYEMVNDIEKIVIYPECMKIYFNISRIIGVQNSSIAGMEDLDTFLKIDYGNMFNYRKQKNDDRNQIMEIMKENHKITAKELAEKFEISLSAIHYRLDILKKQEKIRYNGKGGHGEWTVLE